MAKITSLDDLKRIKEESLRTIQVRGNTGTRIIIGMGTCGISSGARDTMRAVMDALSDMNVEANVSTVGCIGMCTQEPLVDIEQAGKPRVSYGKITADKVPALLKEHLINGKVVEEWVVGRTASLQQEGR
jgi:NADP-reducing hydrogenase subunit HndB